MLARRTPGHAFFSHSTAALLWGAPLPWSVERENRIHISVAAPAARLHSRDVLGHRLDVAEDEVTDWGGLRLTSAARTWLDLASQLSLADLVAVGDYLIHYRAPLVDRVGIAHVLARADGQRGVRLARNALTLLSERAESRPESRLRVMIVTSNLPPVVVNHTLVDSETGKQVRPDFTFQRHHVILEYQGDYHRTKSQWRRDMTRRSRLESQGWKVMELNADDLKNPTELIARIWATINR